MIKILRSDAEEFIKLIKKIYDKKYISKRDDINFVVYKGGYLLQYKNIYYQIKSFEHKWNEFYKEFEERPIEYGFSLPYYAFKRITRLHKNERDEYITFNINQDKFCCKKMAILETILGRFQIDLNSIELDELKKCFKMELNTKVMKEYILKNNKITIQIKITNKNLEGEYNIYLYDKDVLEKFINYLKPKIIKLYYNNDNVYIKIDKALFYIKQWNEED